MTSTLFRSLIPAAIAATSLWIAGGIANKAAKQNASSVWPAVPGLVVESDIIPGGTAENLTHDLAFRCVYQTNTGTHELDRITRFGKIGAYFRGGPTELADTFDPGDTVMVHYNPHRHQEAVVGTGLTQGEMFSAGAVILALLAIGLACGLAAAEPFMNPYVQYKPSHSAAGVGPFNRAGPVESKPRPRAYV
ncbi:MAG: DUF3592 domain-containing protein [Phycisphaerales bacterium JB040]